MAILEKNVQMRAGNTVDAYAAAIPFYLKNGFVLLNEEVANSETRLLYFDLETISDDDL
ncbi:hypothetical protein [Bacteroides rodentium]|jgi:hypothetical protein|uniref:hypothetical protein n=1 Tax=Bacteroides rodentium TaxID=691816 RepID=UPI001427B945|nr:hypothetical protein [Bacteroides rodentium]